MDGVYDMSHVTYRVADILFCDKLQTQFSHNFCRSKFFNDHRTGGCKQEALLLNCAMMQDYEKNAGDLRDDDDQRSWTRMGAQRCSASKNANAVLPGK